MKRKIVALVVVLAILATITYVLVFTDLIIQHSAPAWETLDDNAKVNEFTNWLNGGGDIYFRPGTAEFQQYLDEMHAIYESLGLEWPAGLVDETVTTYGSTDAGVTDSSHGSVFNPIDIFNKPGTNEYTG